MEEPNTEYLYHYTSLDKGLSGILGNGYFRLNPLQNMNDPMDSDPRYFQINFEKKHERDVVNKAYRLQRELDQYIRGQCQLGCFTLDTTDTRDNGIGDGASHGRMWAQYADQNRGLCLVFKKAKLEQAFNRAAMETGLSPVQPRHVNYDDNGYDLSIYEVSYEELVKHGVRSVAENSLQSEPNIHEFFFKKTTDWENEAEHRFVCHGKHPEAGLNIPVDDSLAAVVLGTKTSNAYVPSLRRVSKRYGDVKLRRADFAGDGFIFRLGPVKYNVPISLSPADEAARQIEYEHSQDEKKRLYPSSTQEEI